MQLKFIKQNYIKYNKGIGFISGHVEALHAMPPAADLYTDEIVDKLILNTGCAGIISTVSRKRIDLNRVPNGKNDEGIQEYQNAVKEILHFLRLLDFSTNSLIRPYLHLSFHGMKDIHYGPYAIEIGTLHGMSCSAEIRQWLVDILKKKSEEFSPNIKIILDEKFIGDKAIGYHRLGDGKSYQGYKQNFHSFQIEISHTLRSKYCSEISEIFAQIINEFQSIFVDNC